MSREESKIEQRARRVMRDQYGVLSVKLAMLTDSGWPDVLFVFPRGVVVWVEFKRPGGAVRPRQHLMHRVLKAFGHLVFIFDDADDCIHNLKFVLEELARA